MREHDLTRCVLDLLATPIHVRSGQRSLSRDEIDGHGEFRDVTFAYKDGPAVLKNLAFTVPAGETCGIVGATGAGLIAIATVMILPDIRWRRAAQEKVPLEPDPRVQ